MTAAHRYALPVPTICLLSVCLLAGPVCAGQTAPAPQGERDAPFTETAADDDEYVEEVIVTAERLKKGAIQTYFRRAMAEMPAGAVGRIEEVVAHYREQWSSRDWRVSCGRTVTGSRMGLGVMSLRLNKRLSCTFADEVPVCREPLFDVGDVLNPERPLPLQWVCPPVTG